MKHLAKSVGDFWRRWRSEYLIELRDAHRQARESKGHKGPISVNDMCMMRTVHEVFGGWER